MSALPVKMDSITVRVKIMPFEYYSEEASSLQKIIEVSLPKNSSIKYLFCKLSEDFGCFFSKFVFDKESATLLHNTIIFVNGKALQNLDGWDTRLNEDDTIIIGRMYTGG